MSQEHPPVDAPDSVAPAPHRAEWCVAHRVLFRFGFTYFLLYAAQELFMFAAQLFAQVVGALMGAFASDEWVAAHSDWLAPVFLPGNWIGEAWDHAVRWTAKNCDFLHANVTIGPNGSGDTTWNYVQLVLILAGAVAGSALWSAIAEPFGIRRHEKAAALGRVLCRYYLVLHMFGYGFAKVFRSQFGPPSLLQLSTPYGEFSPMGLLWRLMGYSTAFNVFTGGGEVVSGLFLAFRRTTTLGALVGSVVMLNVVFMNFCFDVPVKLFSSHLLIFMGVLASRDAGRLVNVLVLNRPTAPAPVGRRGWPRFALEALVLVALVLASVRQYFEENRAMGSADDKPPLYGLYEVTDLTRDGAPVPALITDTTRWRQIVIDHGFTRTETDFKRVTKLIARFMDGRLAGYVADIDVDQHTIDLKTQSLSPMEDKDPVRSSLLYSEPEPGTLVLEGLVDGKRVRATLRRRDRDSFPLLNRGFHWINEQPLNR